jgi:serine/threonine protein kinase
VRFGAAEEIAVSAEIPKVPLSTVLSVRDSQGSEQSLENHDSETCSQAEQSKMRFRQSSVIGVIPSGQRTFDGENIPHSSCESAGYVLTEEIAQTNHGAIKLAADTATGSIHCVKWYDMAQIQAQTFEFLKAEVELMFELGVHPHIGGVIEIFQDHTGYYLVQPYYRGDNLVGLKKRAASANIAATDVWWKNIFCQCLEGIAHMHARGVMHCDIKEPNIMLKEEDLQDPEAVIIDLGVAQRASVNRTVIYGTPGYIPPEVWEGKTWYPPSDMFSFGVVVVQLLIGKVGIFTEDTKTYRDVKSATQVRLPPFELMPLECPGLRWVAEKLLAKNHTDRPSANYLLESPWQEEDCNAHGQRRVLQRRHSFHSKTMLSPRSDTMDFPSDTLRRTLNGRDRCDSDRIVARTVVTPSHAKEFSGSEHKHGQGRHLLQRRHTEHFDDQKACDGHRKLVMQNSFQNALPSLPIPTRVHDSPRGSTQNPHVSRTPRAVRTPQSNLSTPRACLADCTSRIVRTPHAGLSTPRTAEPPPMVRVAQGVRGGLRFIA